MNIFSEYKSRVLEIISQLKNEGVLTQDIEIPDFTVTPPKDPSHGDIAINVAMVLATRTDMKPRDLAEKIAEKLEMDEDVRQVDIAGPGFINLYLTDSSWSSLVWRIIELGPDYGRSHDGQGQKLTIEYDVYEREGASCLSSCYCRFLAEALANIQKFSGYDVRRREKVRDIPVSGVPHLSLRLMSDDINRHIKCGNILLKQEGKVIKTSDMPPDISPDSLRFALFLAKNGANLTINTNKAVEQSRDNPSFYVLYTHAQIFSVLRNTHKFFPEIGAEGENLASFNIQQIDFKEKINIIRRIAEYPNIIERISVSNEPHIVAFFLYGLASDFHAIWSLGKEVPQLRFIKEDERELTIANMALLKAVVTVLHSGLKMLGVKPVKEIC